MQKVMTNRALVVSIHDVSPSTMKRTDQILDDLKALGCVPTSLLVIPDHHKRGRISNDNAFVEWLHKKVAEGHEAVLHGYYHLRESRATDGFFKKFVTQSYTAGEGEFFDLSEGETSRRLAMGRAEFSACGLSVSGFIAPAWLLGSDAEVAVRGAGFEYTTRISTVSDFSLGSVYMARSLVWSVRSGWRRVCSLVWNSLLSRSLEKSPLLRIGIHPPDWIHDSIRRQILQLVVTALAGRRAMTYQQWLVSKRGQK
jgi:hypothetical protein